MNLKENSKIIVDGNDANIGTGLASAGSGGSDTRRQRER